MKRRIAQCRLTAAAEKDLDEIFDYTAQRWGPEQAVRYIGAMESTCAALADFPARGQQCDHIRYGYRRTACGQHYVYYLIDSYGVAVIRILHQRMDAPRRL